MYIIYAQNTIAKPTGRLSQSLAQLGNAGLSVSV